MIPRRKKNILIGYYNGAYLQPLDVDIDVHRPELDKDIDKAIGWMEDNRQLFLKFEKPKQGVQITIQSSNLVSAFQFDLAIGGFFAKRRGSFETLSISAQLRFGCRNRL